MSDSKWATAFLLLSFLLYSWVLYHLAYAKGAFVEMGVNQTRLQSCQAVLIHNGAYR